MKQHHNTDTATAALAMLGRDGDTITCTATTLGISPGAMLAAAWTVLERQSTDAQPWPEVAGGWVDEASAIRTDVLMTAVRLEASQRGRKAA